MYTTKKRAERITKIVKLFPHNGSITKIAPNEEEISAARDLTKAFKMKYNNQPIASNKNITVVTLNSLVDIFLHKTEAKKTARHKPKHRHTSQKEHQP